jgi:hypothetical protein
MRIAKRAGNSAGRRRSPGGHGNWGSTERSSDRYNRGFSSSEGSEEIFDDPSVLERGEYPVKVYVDRLAEDPTLLLDADDFAGQTVLKKSRWRDVFP